MFDVEQQLAELTRGVVEIHQPLELKKRLTSGKPLLIKAGFDPTRPDLHLGHAVLLQKMRQFQDFGHRVLFLIGDFTALIGDPTGQNEMRPRLTKQQVSEAAQTYQEQAFKILDRSRTEVRSNSEWLGGMKLDEVIELLARRTLARTLERRDFRERLETQRDVHLHELVYPLLQGYDSVALKCDVELGGTDQLFNLLVGRDLMQRYGQEPQIVMTTPILEGLDARIEDGVIVGKKMSKSADNYIGLTDAPLEMFRKCMQIDDSVVWRFYELLSARSSAEIAELKASLNPLDAKRRFALEMVARFHDQAAAEQAQTAFQSAYMADGVPEDTPELEVPCATPTLWLPKALSVAGLVASTSEGRRMIEQGGVEVDATRVVDPQHQLESGKRYLVRVGSKRRRFCYIRVARA